MKKLVFIIITLILIKPVLPVIDYVINYEYITTKLCKNIDKPILKCNGKCHLAKELAKAAQTENPLKSDKKQTFKFEIEVLFCKSISNDNSPLVLNLTINKTTDFYSNLYLSQNLSSVFHPPSFVS
ncbi:MAG TPA: hypothetical protein DDZ41_08565 [Flavobacterium sp.]|nr:hypothetical protein [Flavobacterium sp.]